MDVTERVQRLEDNMREEQVDKAVRQLLVYGWGAETKNQRKQCVKRWLRNHNLMGAYEYIDTLRKPDG
eukprot:2656874-Alexandrium_andersonii.AAC.1